ncbi:DNA-binding NarL/FixJ family response regulator [Amycolatopsis bartoniae]|uniref:Helix-turn-helix transcriptional regulator n=1 Tax=Amycolatopsis bartoniae TaxID=941986 RepID=A0A8H9M8V1_9PSEU|nr:response regulator transcription factor [Amycolatopsis bartoniae]MBB2934787.1 DNA-binding NarL/FixJ family response regulator [Amycolatopsis bartoniae]TVT02425.1 response regulator transcription factor [Amycolatopsis bartoniae]GHF44730.1 helix-turn-helix transcriptional regulator [Amycolatopsis bartoniae]
MEQVRVGVCALDPITRAGLVNCLEPQAGVVVVADPSQEHADVVVAAFDQLTPDAVAALHEAADVTTPVILVQDQVGGAELLTSVERRVVAFLPRAAATDERLVQSVRAIAAGEDAQPNVLGQLLAHTRRLQQEMVEAEGDDDEASLSPREIEVLRLMADGLDTNEIARELRYSERTVKNIIYTLTNRLRLHNRSHAVAYAMRAGII